MKQAVSYHIKIYLNILPLYFRPDVVDRNGAGRNHRSGLANACNRPPLHPWHPIGAGHKDSACGNPRSGQAMPFLSLIYPIRAGHKYTVPVIITAVAKLCPTDLSRHPIGAGYKHSAGSNPRSGQAMPSRSIQTSYRSRP